MRASPKEQALSNKRITRRGLIVAGAQLGLMGVLGWRMRQLQLEQADEFRLLAEENRVNIRLLAPERGMVFDREGRIIAENEQNYRVVMIREDAGDVDMVLVRLAALIGLSAEEVAEARKDIFNRSSFVPVTVADRLPWEDVARVAANAPALPGIHADYGLSRYYPRGADL
ncbi:MAG: penicillin-binding protein 2, partial [Pseudomonadota bacterium]